jgi:hypothetical protein
MDLGFQKPWARHRIHGPEVTILVIFMWSRSLQQTNCTCVKTREQNVLQALVIWRRRGGAAFFASLATM